MSDSSGRFFEGLLLGSIFGFLFGMLAAPKSGAEFRKQLADDSEELYKQASDSLSDLKKKGDQALSDIQQKSSSVIKKARAGVHDTKEQLSNKFERLAGQSTQVLVDEPSP